jgi:hypothetical protein
MVYSTIKPPSPPQRHTVCIYCTKVWEGWEGGGGQREGRGATVQYTSIVLRLWGHYGGDSSQAESKMPTMSECISSL